MSAMCNPKKYVVRLAPDIALPALDDKAPRYTQREQVASKLIPSREADLNSLVA
jgi:hypothetical protein